MFLVEALVAILLFSVGILGMVGMSAFATAAQSDAQYRTLAANLASRIAQEAWVMADRHTGTTPEQRTAALATSLMTFQHNAGGADCAFSGGAGTHPAAVAWALDATTPGSDWYLPGATTAMQQVVVDTAAGFNRLTVTVCWKVPANPAARQHVLVTYVN